MTILRIWHGWTSAQNADAYEQLLRSEVLPAIHRIQGYRGAWLLRRADTEREAGEVEFITITTWESWEAIHEFSSDGHTGAVVPEKARRLLARFDEHSQHYLGEWVG
jgi:heme-degrading monooxygenase HmoA